MAKAFQNRFSTSHKQDNQLRIKTLDMPCLVTTLLNLISILTKIGKYRYYFECSHVITPQRNSKKPSFSKKIAVVDDEGDIAQMFTDALKSNGYRAKAFTDPLVAFDQICSDHSSYGLVLSDVRMPALSGIELATKLKEKYKKIKIILMSAYETEYIRVSNMKNIDYFISKPAHIEKVLGIIDNVVSPEKIKIVVPTK